MGGTGNTFDRGALKRVQGCSAEAEYEAKEKESIEIFRSDRSGWRLGQFVPVLLFCFLRHHPYYQPLMPMGLCKYVYTNAARSKQRQCLCEAVLRFVSTHGDVKIFYTSFITARVDAAAMGISAHRRGQVSYSAGRDIKRSLCEEGKNPRWADGLATATCMGIRMPANSYITKEIGKKKKKRTQVFLSFRIT